MSLDAFSSTVERLYAAAADPSRWTDALRAVEDFTGSAGAVVCFAPEDPDKDKPFVLAGRFTPEQCEEYARDFTAICPRTDLAKRRPDLPFHYDALLGNDAELDRDPTYEWFEKRNGVRYYLGVALADVGGYRVNTSVQRARAQGHVQKADLELYGRLRPHLDQALRLSELIGTLGHDRGIGFAALEEMAHGIVVLDADARLLFANAAAEATLRGDGGLRVTRGRLGAARTADARALRRLIGSAAAGEGARGGWMRVTHASTERGHAVFAAPLAVEDALPGLARPRVLVAIFDLDAGSEVDAGALESLFGLSAKQAEIATLLARGQELGTVARRLDISPDTARTHLKGIFRKLEVNRQPDLAGLLAKLAAVRN